MPLARGSLCKTIFPLPVLSFRYAQQSLLGKMTPAFLGEKQWLDREVDENRALPSPFGRADQRGLGTRQVSATARVVCDLGSQL